MQLANIVTTSASVAGTRSRLKKVAMLADCLRQMDRQEMRAGVSFLMGALPQGKVGLGYTAVSAAAAEPCAQARLSLADVQTCLQQISEQTGRGSQDSRQKLLSGLMQGATRDEQTFLTRLILGELRQGALEGLTIDAIGKAGELPIDEVRRAVMLNGDPAEVAIVAMEEGLSGLQRFTLQLFRPIKPMLARPAEGTADALFHVGRAALEYKIDGARVQIHKQGDEVVVFTRQLNDVTTSVPDLVDAVRRLPVASIILDGEAVALDRERRPLPFQVTMRRFGRRLDVGQMQERIPLSGIYFDCLYLDGESLFNQPQALRMRALVDSMPGDMLVPNRITERAADADAFLRQAMAAGHEGIMAKSLEAAYQAGSRGDGWFKIKLAHTLDLVVLAAEWGSGRRQGKLSNLHLGARDEKTNAFVMLGKTFKGLTDAMLDWQTKALLAREIGREGPVVHVRPELVVEVAFNDLQRSKHYPGGMALRFARVKSYRRDKPAQEADTLSAVRAIFDAQFSHRRQ